MTVLWKTIITVFLLYVVVIDANRARRRRQSGSNPQPANRNVPSNTFNAQTDARQQPLGPNLQILNAQGQPQSQMQLPQQQQQQQQPMMMGQGNMGAPRDANSGQGQMGRQYSQYGYGSQGSYNNPYGSMGGGSQYGMGGMGQYNQYGQGMGQYGSSYQNQYPGAGNFYSGYGGSGYGSSSYNRPGYQSNYYPSGGNNYGGYFWNAGQKQHANFFTVFLSSILALTICLIAI